MVKKAPLPGSYTGTLAGNNAIFVVNMEVVEALWYEPSPRASSGFHEHADTWDIENGKYSPTFRGNPVEVKINVKSRRAAEDSI